MKERNGQQASNDTFILPGSATFKIANPLLLGEASWGDDAVGVWKTIPGRSTFAADGLARIFTLRIERRPGGEVFASDLKIPVRKVRISYEATSHEETPMKVTFVHGLRASRRAFFAIN